MKNIKLLEALLVPRGYRVVQAFEGEEALRQVAEAKPDLVLLDVMMPVMDGFEVCRRLKGNAQTCLIPVVIMTALDRVEDRVKGIEAGAGDFLTKPVHRDELMARVRTSLHLKQTIDRKVAAASAPLYLTIRRQGDTLSMDLTEGDPVVPQAQTRLEEGLLTEIGEELASIAMLASTDGVHVALQRLGGLVYAYLFPAPIQQRLAEMAPTELVLRLDDGLLHLPWELAFDGQAFLCTKFRLGRQVLTREPVLARSTRGSNETETAKPAADRGSHRVHS